MAKVRNIWWSRAALALGVCLTGGSPTAIFGQTPSDERAIHLVGAAEDAMFDDALRSEALPTRLITRSTSSSGECVPPFSAPPGCCTQDGAGQAKPGQLQPGQSGAADGAADQRGSAAPVGTTPLAQSMSSPFGGGGQEFLASSFDAPAMIGDFFGAGRGVILDPGGVFQFDDDDFDSTTLPSVPSPTIAMTGRIKTAETSSPLPTDRILFNYSFFDQTIIAPDGFDVHRFTPGFEKTFFDGQMSVEVRAPFASTLNSDVGLQPDSSTETTSFIGDRNVEFGNLVVGAKALVYRQDRSAVAIGTFVALPTANDITFTSQSESDPDESQSLTSENEAVHLMPYIGGIHYFTDRFFFQGFLQVDFDANGQPVIYRDEDDEETRLGTLNDQTFLFLDLGAGYWLKKSDLCNWAAIFEVHYNASLTSPDTVQDPDTEVGLAGGTGDVNIVNLVFGTAVQFETCALSAGYVLPVGAGGDEQFDGELRAQYIWYFGGGPRWGSTFLGR